MIELSDTIEIDQPAESIWQVITDFNSYDEWNPYLSVQQGTPAEETAIVVDIRPSAGPSRTETGKLTTVVPSEHLQWETVAFYHRLYTSGHAIELEPLDEAKTQVTNRRWLGGVLTYFISTDKIEADLSAMNTALANRLDQVNR
ncbi:SRPBCC family protein [Natrialbaceae archaeon A-arb3/5]